MSYFENAVAATVSYLKHGKTDGEYTKGVYAEMGRKFAARWAEEEGISVPLACVTVFNAACAKIGGAS